MKPKLVLIDHRSVPPDGFRFTQPETGYFHSSWDEHEWLKSIKKYRADNGLAPIDEADIYDQFCKLLPPGLCRYDNGERPTWFVSTRLQVADILNGTKVLAGFVFNGMPLVNKELAEARSATCGRCPFNVEISGCQPCTNLAEIVVSVGGDMKTKSDNLLKHCAICLCSNLAQTRVPIEILAKGVTQEMATKFKSIEWCWKAKELTAAGLA